MERTHWITVTWWLSPFMKPLRNSIWVNGKTNYIVCIWRGFISYNFGIIFFGLFFVKK